MENVVGICELIERIDCGDFARDATRAISEVVESLRIHGGKKSKGTITLKIEFGITGGAVVITGGTTVKRVPRPSDGIVLMINEHDELVTGVAQQRSLLDEVED